MWVKVCGVRNQSTATALAGLPDGDRPDAVGLNFFPGSRRCIDITVARSILASLDGKIEPVGLFVNAPLRQVVSFQEDMNLPILQLHGDESPEYVAEVQQSCGSVRILKAMRVGEEGLGELADYLRRCQVLGVVLDGCLVDASVDGQFGGTGESPPWSLLATGYQAVAWPPLLLAGGLRPDNVGRAIREVSPAGVDTASGVENTDGDKDMEAVVEFVRNARAAASESQEKLDG